MTTSDALLDESMQHLAQLRGHTINIIKALNKIERVIESIQSRMNKIEGDMRMEKDNIEALKQSLGGVEEKITEYHEKMKHINKILEALFEV